MQLVRRLKNKNAILIDKAPVAYQAGRADSVAFTMVFSGLHQYQIGSRKLRLYPGRFLVMDEDTSYERTVTSEVPVDSFSVNFDTDFISDFHRSHASATGRLLDDPVTKPAPIRFPLTMFPFQDDIRYNITNLRNALEAGFDDDMLLSGYLSHCLYNYYTVYHAEVVSRAEKLSFIDHSTKSEVLRRLLLARDYMVSQHDQKIKLEEVAAVACLSVNHFLRTFKEAYDTSPYKFLLKVRLERAKSLLQGGCYTVNEIAHIVGFDCPSSFIKQFRQAYRTTPLKFRRLA